MMDNQQEHCCYCGLVITISIFRTTEHIIPRSKMGTNATVNKRPCCTGCNAMRGSMSLDRFLEHVMALSNANPADERLKGMIPRIKSVMQLPHYQNWQNGTK